MTTYGDGLEPRLGTPRLGDAADAHAPRRHAPDGAGDLPAPVIPPSVLPAATSLPAPDRSSVPVTSLAAPVSAGAAAPPNSYTDIRAVHEATTQQLRERRAAGVNGASGRSVAIACAVVVLGGIAFVLGAVLL